MTEELQMQAEADRKNAELLERERFIPGVNDREWWFVRDSALVLIRIENATDAECQHLRRVVLKLPDTPREFWKEKIESAIEMATDDELRRMANHYMAEPGAAFILEIRHDPDSHFSMSRATVVSESRGTAYAISEPFRRRRNLLDVLEGREQLP